MPYTHFQYIAYQVPTVTRTAPYPNGQAIYGIPPGRIVNPPQLRGNVGGLGPDAKTRIERFIGVMVEAQQTLQRLGDNNHTIKVFMAPEFYFRPNNAKVSYTYAQYRAIKNVLRETITAHNQFRHWLVVPGTILWEWTANTPGRPNPTGKSIFFNTAIYIKERDTRTIEKYAASTIDGIPTGRHGGGGTGGQSTDEAFPKYYQTPAKMEKHLFRIKGIKVGLDICLEHVVFSVLNPAGPGHRYGVVKKSLSNRITGAFNRRNEPIHLHLLTAGGMGIVPSSVAATTNGWILRNDGYNVNILTECKQVTGYNYGEAYDLCNTAILGPELTTLHSSRITDRNLYLEPPPAATSYWATHPQMIKIYERQVLP